MSEARHVLLGDLGEFRRGQGGTKRDDRVGGTPCIRYGELYTEHDVRIRHFVSFIDPAVSGRYSELRSGDLIFAASGETHEEIGKGGVFLGEGPPVAGADTIILRPKAVIDPLFLSYAANSAPAARLKARRGQGSSVIHIAARHLSEVPIWLPGIAEQRLIAEVLDTVDEAIRKTEEIIAKLKQVKQGLLHDLLTRGIDENGELRDPDRHPEQFKDSPLGRIPKAWRVLSLREVGDWTSGGTPSKANPAFWGGDIPWVSPKDMKVFRLRSTIDWVTGKGASSGTRTVPAGSVFIVVRGMILAHTFPVCIADQEMAFNQDVKGIVPCADVRGDFLGYWFVANSDAMLALVTEATHGTKRIELGDLLRHPIGIPRLVEQDAILSRLSEASAKEAHEVAALEKFRLLKRGLMEDLLTGRVRVTPLLDSSNSHEQPTTVSEAS